MDREKENSRSLIVRGYGEARPRKKRPKRRSGSRTVSASKGIPLLDRSDVAQHRKRAERNAAATVFGTDEDGIEGTTTSSIIAGTSNSSSSSNAAKQNWQSHRPLQDAMSVISRNRLTQPVGKVGIYNQAKTSQPVQRDSQGSIASQHSPPGNTAFAMPVRDESSSRPIVLTTGNLRLFNRQQEGHGRSTHADAALSRGAPSATPCSDTGAGGECGCGGGAGCLAVQASARAGSQLPCGAHPHRQQLYRSSAQEIDDICLRLTSTVKPDLDFNISYRQQLMAELRKMAAECAGWNCSPLRSSTPAATSLSLPPSRPGSGTTVAITSCRAQSADQALLSMSAAAATASMDVAMDTDPGQAAVSLASGLDLPDPTRSTGSSHLDSPSLVVQQVVEEHYPMSMQSGPGQTSDIQSNPLAIFAHIVSSQDRVDERQISIPSALSAATNQSLAIPTPAASSMFELVASLPPDVSSSCQLPLPGAVSDPHASSVGNQWMYPDEGPPPLPLPTTLLASLEAQSMSHSLRGRLRDDTSRFGTLASSATSSSRSAGQYPPSLQANDPDDMLAHRHSVLELLPPQLHRQPLSSVRSGRRSSSSTDSHLASSLAARNTHDLRSQRSTFVEHRPAMSEPIMAHIPIPGTYGTFYEQRYGPQTAANSSASSSTAAGAGAFPDFLDELEHGQLAAEEEMHWNEGAIRNRLATTSLMPPSKPGVHSPSTPDFKLFPQKMF